MVAFCVLNLQSIAYDLPPAILVNEMRLRCRVQQGNGTREMLPGGKQHETPRSHQCSFNMPSIRFFRDPGNLVRTRIRLSPQRVIMY